MVVTIPLPAAAASRDLEKARAAYDDLRYEEVLPLLELALAQATDDQELAEIFELMGFVHTAFGAMDKAKAAFVELLLRRPDHELAAGLSPKIREAYGNARFEIDQVWAAETIAAQPVADGDGALHADVTAPAGEPAVLETWWFWTIVAGVVVVAAGATTVGVVAGTGGSEPQSAFDFGPLRF